MVLKKEWDSFKLNCVATLSEAFVERGVNTSNNVVYSCSYSNLKR